jgi:hypothetical protein
MAFIYRLQSPDTIINSFLVLEEPIVNPGDDEGDKQGKQDVTLTEFFVE